MFLHLCFLIFKIQTFQPSIFEYVFTETEQLWESSYQVHRFTARIRSLESINEDSILCNTLTFLTDKQSIKLHMLVGIIVSLSQLCSLTPAALAAGNALRQAEASFKTIIPSTELALPFPGTLRLPIPPPLGNLDMYVNYKNIHIVWLHFIS